MPKSDAVAALVVGVSLLLLGLIGVFGRFLVAHYLLDAQFIFDMPLHQEDGVKVQAVFFIGVGATALGFLLAFIGGISLAARLRDDHAEQQ